MFKNTRVMSGIIAISWGSLLIELIVLELSNLSITAMLAPIILSAVITITFLTLFIMNYYKNRKSVEKLKDEYLEGLKPKNPLRFCPSDDELLKMYKANKINEQVSNPQINNNQPKREEQISKPSERISDEEEITM